MIRGAAGVRARHPVAALAAANLMFAAAFPASAVALRAFGPFVLTGVRFAVAAALFAPLALSTLRSATASERRRLLLVAGAGLWLQMVLLYYGIDASQAAVSAVIVGLEPVWVALWAALLLSERLHVRTALGLVVALAGSLLVSGVGSGGASAGLLFLLGTGVAFSFYTVGCKAFLGRFGARQLVAVLSLLGAAVGLVPMLLEVLLANGLGDVGAGSVAAVLYLGVGNSALAYVLWNRALMRLPAGVVGTTLYAQPVLGAAASWLALREPLPAGFLPGTALVLLGLWIALRRGRRR